jgi:LytS/YehU family sensor histidine kinase/Tfp pilus assembly protein PilF
MNLKNFSSCFSIGIFFTLLSISSYGQELPIIDSLKKELVKTIPDTNRVNILNEIGGYTLKAGRFDEAGPYLLASEKLAENLSYKKGLATCLNMIAVMHMDKNEYELATAYYMKALDIKKEMGDLKGAADVVSNLGILFSEQDDYPQALNCYLISLRIREAIHDGFGIGTSLSLIANIYFQQKDYTNALKYSLQTLQIKEVDDDIYFKAIVMNNVGMAYVNLENYPEALTYFTQALELHTKVSDKEGVGYSYSNIGGVYSKNGHLKEALAYYTKGLEIFKEVGFKKGVAESYECLGLLYEQLGQNTKALECYNQQLIVAMEIGSKANIATSHSHISDTYGKMNNYQKAYEHYKLSREAEENIRNESTMKAMNEMEIKYKTQKKEIEIETLRGEKYQREILYHKQQQVAYGIILALIIIAVVFFFLFNRRRIRKKQLLERVNFEIQLKALSEQMNPHFIFNSLNSIMEFIRTSEKEAALKYLTKFSRLIRLVLESSGKESVVLMHEIELLKLYMELENLRFGGIFTYEIHIDKAIDLYNAEIPPLIIQPFIENSILHGIQNKLKIDQPPNYAGKITVDLALQGEFLNCIIRDNGIGRKRALELKSKKLLNHQSLGMRITNNRLSLLTQNKCKIEWVDLEDENHEALGTEVRILIPLIDNFD